MTHSTAATTVFYVEVLELIPAVEDGYARHYGVPTTGATPTG
jgi:hypothetical protein